MPTSSQFRHTSMARLHASEARRGLPLSTLPSTRCRPSLFTRAGPTPTVVVLC